MRFASTSIPAFVLAFTAIGAIAGISAAYASVPSPANSTIPACIHASPDASLPSVFIIRDLANNPINGSMVQLIYADCAEFHPCPQTGSPPDDYILDVPNQQIRGFTNSAGQAIFSIRAGGGCLVYPIRVYADGVFLGYRRAASTDQNGDFVVNGADVAILTSKVGGSDLTGDLDCNGVVNSYDLSIQAGSLGSSCLVPTSARRSSWGTLKLIYR